MQYPLQKKHHARHLRVGVLVLALHGALMYALWRARPSAMPEAPTPVFVRWVDTPTAIAKNAAERVRRSPNAAGR